MVVKLAQSLECVKFRNGLEKAKCLIVLVVGLARDLFIKNKANSQML